MYRRLDLSAKFFDLTALEMKCEPAPVVGGGGLTHV